MVFQGERERELEGERRERRERREREERERERRESLVMNTNT